MGGLEHPFQHIVGIHPRAICALRSSVDLAFGHCVDSLPVMGVGIGCTFPGKTAFHVLVVGGPHHCFLHRSTLAIALLMCAPEMGVPLGALLH